MKKWKDGRQMVKIRCKNCNTEFTKDKSEYNRCEKNNRSHYCSKKCLYESKKQPITDRCCKQCGSKISNTKPRNVFCSHKCSAIYNNKHRKTIKYNYSDEAKNNIRISRIKSLGMCVEYLDYIKNPKHCKKCGNEIPFAKRNRVFCSIECKRKYDSKNVTEYQKYYRNCAFTFKLSDYPDEFDFELIKKYGWYQAKNHGDNLNGISRDHMVSIMFGYENDVNSSIISHPANCQLMRHNDNSSKWKKCSLTLDELQNRIIEWNKKYK